MKRCELITSSRKRAAANKQTAAIRDNFPPGIAQPALRALAAAGYTKLDDLTNVREVDLAKLHGIGPSALRILKDELVAQGKSFLK
jgi:hypothetical protein